jgi:hypothetical protein
MLEVYRQRAGQLRPSTVLSDYETNRFVRPSSFSPKSLLKWEQIAFSHLPSEFQPVALSPVCPLGTNSIVASVDQNWTVSTSRNTEVVSDSTNVLALECSIRRRELLRANPKSTDTVHLATSHRLLRAQHFKKPGQTAHFSAFTLCSASRDQGGLNFEISSLRLHICFYLEALRDFLGPQVPLQVSVTDMQKTRRELIEAQFFAPLRNRFVNVDYVFDDQRTGGQGYYVDLCFHIHAAAASRQQLELADGGSVTWTQKYLSNDKERLVISGIGSERLCSLFNNTA